LIDFTGSAYSVGPYATFEGGIELANDIPHLLTVKEFAKVMRIHMNTARRIIARGSVPTINLGDRTTRIPVTAITSALKESRR